LVESIFRPPSLSSSGPLLFLVAPRAGYLLRFQRTYCCSPVPCSPFTSPPCPIKPFLGAFLFLPSAFPLFFSGRLSGGCAFPSLVADLVSDVTSRGLFPYSKSSSETFCSVLFLATPFFFFSYLPFLLPSRRYDDDLLPQTVNVFPLLSRRSFEPPSPVFVPVFSPFQRHCANTRCSRRRQFVYFLGVSPPLFRPRGIFPRLVSNRPCSCSSRGCFCVVSVIAWFFPPPRPRRLFLFFLFTGHGRFFS